jgi:hypothetical protein
MKSGFVFKFLAGLGLIIFLLLMAAPFWLFDSGPHTIKSVWWPRKVNLMRLNSAIRHYEFDHREYPPRLSNLVPDYIKLSDAAILFSPTDSLGRAKREYRRTPKTLEEVKLADSVGAYVYLGGVNHTNAIILYEKIEAWDAVEKRIYGITREGRVMRLTITNLLPITGCVW